MYPPCLNPSCHSHGKPHPNCRCYTMSEGGIVGHFCDQDRMHKPDCEYFAEGGAVNFIPDSPPPVTSDTIDFTPDNQEAALQDKYGGPLEQTRAAVEGVGRGLAGPLATATEVALGVPKEDIEGREAANPVTHGIGQAAGLIAPAVMTGGASTLTQAGLLANVAKSIAPKVASSVAGQTAVKMGLQTALFTLGDEVSHYISGNPNSMQVAATHVGLSGLMGAVTGYPLGKASDLWVNKLGPKAEQVAIDFAEKMQAHAIDLEAAENLPSTTLGHKVADYIANKASYWASEAAAGGLGAKLGKMTGIPGGKVFGFIFGEKYLGPLIQKVMPTIIDPLLSTIPSGEGMKAAFQAINAVAKGESLMSHSAKAIFQSGGTSALSHLIPDPEKVKKLDEHLKDLKDHPEQLMEVGGSLGHYLPNQATALAQSIQQTTNYLAQERPKTIKNGVLDAEREPSSQQNLQYKRTLQIAEQPLSVIPKIQNGTLLKKDVQDIQAMYPEVYMRMVQKINDAMVAHVAGGDNVPYNTRRGLSLFLGQPLDSTMYPQAMQLMQSTYMPPGGMQAPQNAPKSKGSPKALSNLPKSYEGPSEARQRTLRK